MLREQGRIRLGSVLNLALSGVFVVAAILAVKLVNVHMRQQALTEAESKARILLDRNLATHTYFSHDLKPHLFEWSEPFRSDDYFEPTWMSSTYAVREIDAYFEALNPADYYYKESAVNARSPENEADPFERAFIDELNADPELVERSLVRVLEGEPYFVTLRRGEVMGQSCLRCHDTPAQAPAGLVEAYGPERSFDRRVGEVISAISIRVPLSAAYAQANEVSWRLSVLLLLLLVFLFVVQYGLHRRLLFGPLNNIRDKALQIAAGGERLGEQIPVPFGQELGQLTEAFNQMSRSLRRNVDQLEDRVEQRTAELARLNEQLQQDILERERVESKLRESQALLRQMGRMAKVGGWEFDAETGKQVWTEEVYRIHQVDLDYGPTVEKGLGFFPPESKAIIESAVQEAVDEGKPYDLELPFVTAKGNRRWVHTIGRAHRRNGETEKVSGTIQDITERVEAQQALRESNRRLEATLAELKAAQEELVQQERLAAVGQLSAGLAHEFNNILASIILYSEMLLNSPHATSKDQGRATAIRQQGRVAANLVQQILDFGRKAVLRREDLDLIPFLEALRGDLEQQMPEEIQIYLDHADEELLVNADAQRLRQMMMNLALNARDAMQEQERGELRITVFRAELKEATTCVVCGGTIAASDGWVQIALTDNGVGIPPDVLPHIFEPFFTTRAPLGSGLGLAQVYGIVKQHGGHLSVDTQVGSGTTITVFLPSLSAPPVRAEPLQPEPMPLPMGRGETVLVVEDDAAMRRALVDSLETLNYRALVASEGQEALEILEREANEISVVLSDWTLPSMGGKALVQALEERELTAKVVILSTHALADAVIDVPPGAVSDWIQKPPSLEQLAKAISRSLER